MSNKRKWLDVVARRAPRYRHANLQEKLDRVFSGPVPITALSFVHEKLQGIPYAFIGGHAVSVQQGIPRLTSDVDVLVEPQHLDEVLRRLGGKLTGALSIGGASVEIDGLTVDVVAPAVGWVGSAVAEADDTKYGKVVSKPYLVISKLWAARGEIDDADVLGIIRKMTPEDKKKVKKLAETYLSYEDAEDLNQFIDIAEMPSV
ncbi:MAG: hypothetical protein Q8K86_05805 [Candidatus Nanopelagicaceae bacterium]|nr:hypothetical protein [Candidatus Nanopelagicaceae bacterium]